MLLLSICFCVSCVDESETGKGWSPELVTKASRLMTRDDGGTLSLGDVIIEIPPGSLSKDAMIYIEESDIGLTPLAGETSVGHSYLIDAEDAEFKKLFTIVLPYNEKAIPSGLTEDDLAIGYLENSSWHVIDSIVDKENNLLICEVSHLTWYQPWTWGRGPKVELIANPISYTGITSSNDYKENLIFTVKVTDPDSLDNLKSVQGLLRIKSLESWGFSNLANAAVAYSGSILTPIGFHAVSNDRGGVSNIFDLMPIEGKEGEYQVTLVLTDQNSLSFQYESIIFKVFVEDNDNHKVEEEKEVTINRKDIYAISNTSPKNGAIVSSTPLFKWNASNTYNENWGPQLCRLVVDQDDNPFNKYAWLALKKDIVSDNYEVEQEYQVTMSEALKPGTYHWGIIISANDENIDYNRDIKHYCGKFEVRKIIPQTPPQAISLFLPSSVTKNTMTLTWTENNDEDFAFYKILMATKSGVDSLDNVVAIIYDKWNTFKTITGLKPNTRYFFKVYTYDDTNLSTPSNEINEKTLQDPGSIPNTSPSVTITYPSDNSHYTQGDTIYFSGTAFDSEDGNLTGTSLAWWSNLEDQKLGSGNNISLSSLSTGRHTISLVASDSKQKKGHDTLTILIEDSRRSVGPIVYDSCIVNDSGSYQTIGNNNAIPNPGERIKLEITLKNQGIEKSGAVFATLSSSDPYVTWQSFYTYCYDPIPASGKAYSRSNQGRLFDISSSAPDGYEIPFELVVEECIKDDDGIFLVVNTWNSNFNLTITKEEVNSPPNQPSLTSPFNNETDIKVNPTLFASTFSDPDTSDSHQSTTWEISDDELISSESLVWQANMDTSNLTSIVVNSTNGIFQNSLGDQAHLDYQTLYWVRVKYHDNHGLGSYFSNDTKFNTSSDELVIFSDSNLEQKIREEISKPSGNIYKSDLINLTDLDARSLSITNISGIEYCINLSYLSLNYNQISDIIPLSKLSNLTELVMLNNQISDVSALSNLTNLSILWLIGNQITDITPLSTLNALTTLHLDANNISNINPVANLTNLTELGLMANQISDISALFDLTELRSVYISGNQITDISALFDLTELRSVDISSNQITDISALSGIQDPWRIYLSNNQVTQIDTLVSNDGIDSGDEVDLSNNPLDIDDLPNIQILEDRGVNVTHTIN